jgi:two-component system cell cycle sensor histidine kinase/response regulator CckA
MYQDDPAELAMTLFQEAGDALILVNPDDDSIIDANPVAERLCQFSCAELLRMKATYLFRSEAQGGMNRLRMATNKTGVFHSQEGFLIRTRQDRVWIPGSTQDGPFPLPGNARGHGQEGDRDFGGRPSARRPWIRCPASRGSPGS